MQLVFASNNSHKLSEIRHIFINRGIREIELISLKDIGFSGDIEETETTLEGNALLKARFIHQKFGVNCFADDTGLEVDALDGRPGVYSARYAGEGCTFDDNVEKILNELKGINNRAAHFRTAIALIINNKEYLFEGKVIGTIINSKRGSKGFGYDPVFIPENYNQTFAEMEPEIKNSISHRYKALDQMIGFLENYEPEKLSFF